MIVKFIVVDLPLIYSIILGRPTINALKAIVSTYHLLNFLVGDNVCKVRGDQYKARRCYILALREKSLNAFEVHMITAIPVSPDKLISPQVNQSERGTSALRKVEDTLKEDCTL